MLISSYFPKDSFKGKTVFITGGAGSINFGIAKNFAALGANIGMCGRTAEKLEAACKELEGMGVKTAHQAADVRDYKALEASIHHTRDTLGPIDVLVCAAAGNFPCPAEGLSANGFKSVIDIDVLGTFNACRAAIDQLKETKGNVIFISAGQAYMPYALQCHVGAAKAANDNLMKNLALEWGPYGIRCNSIVPGPIAGTEGMKRLAPGEIGEKLNEHIPLRRHGQIDDIGQAAVFLASPLASYITGTVLVVDGGQNLPGSGGFQQALMEAMGG